MTKTRKLIIIGDSAFAEIAYEYFTADSQYEVVAFSVEQADLTREQMHNLPVVPFEQLEAQFPPADYDFFVAIGYTQLNRLRTRLFQSAKARGYRPASYVSSRAFVWRNVSLGEHCFIFESNVVQPYVRVGDNVVLWSGNHIGHHSSIGDNSFVASQAVISGFVNLGKNSVIETNATIANNITIGEDCLIGAGAIVARDVPTDHIVEATASSAGGSARRLHRVAN